MKSLISSAEIEELGEKLIRDYIGGREPPHCVDIEGFLTEYLQLPLRYESMAETDPDKIGFVSDGAYPLKIRGRDGIEEKVFPKGTVVIDRFLLRPGESGRRRFTIAHEGAHILLDRMSPIPVQPRFSRVFACEQQYDAKELFARFNLNEIQSDEMAAVLLMPRFLIARSLDEFADGKPIPLYGSNVFDPSDKLVLQRMADAMGVSYTALVIRLRGLGLLERHDLSEYVEKQFRAGGVC